MPSKELAKIATGAIQAPNDSPYKLDPAQTLRAANALLKKMQSDMAARSSSGGKQDLLGDSDVSEDDPIWLCVTTKKHIVDEKRLKPGKIALPHALNSIKAPTDDEPGTKVCLITADPQREYKDIVAHPNFPENTRGAIARVIGLSKLKAKYKSYEARRQLVSEYDIFLADDRVVTYLPKMLGKVFYASGAKRPIPVSLQGKKEDKDEKGEKRKPLAQGGSKAIRNAPKPEMIANEIERALKSALIHLSPSTNTSVRVGTTAMRPDQVKENIEAVVAGLVDTYIPKGWRNIRALHIKGPRTTSLPIWLTDEMWVKEDEVLEEDPVKKSERSKAVLGKRRAAESSEVAKAGKKVKGDEDAGDEKLEKEAQKARKAEMKKLKEQSRLEIKAAS